MERLAGRVMLLSGWRRALAAFAAGLLAAFAQAPFDFFAAAFIAFPILVWLIDGTVTRPGAGLVRRALAGFPVGWWFGFGYFLAGLWWVGNALLVEAELFAWALPLAILGLPALLALFYGLATALARALWSDGIGRFAALGFAFGVAEWLRAVVLTGFPWSAIGLAAMPLPVLMQSVRLTGLFAINGLAVLVFALPAAVGARRGRMTALLLGLVLVAAHAGYGMWQISRASPAESLLRVRIVQPSIAQAQKWDTAERDRIFARYLELSDRPADEGAAAPDLIVWPETALPFLFTDRPDALVALSELLDEGQLLLAGAVRAEGPAGDPDRRYYNSVMAIDPEGVIVDAVDKVHLVPFGEYLPMGDLLARFGLRQIAQSVGGFSAGAARRTLTVAGGVEALPFICYEIIFPGVAGYGRGGADFLVNLTNDAWFGDTPGPYQHFRQAQIRAVEAGLPMVRAANNGISAVVDPYGRIIDAFAVDAAGVLDADVPALRRGRETRLSPLVASSLILASLFAFGILARLRKK